MVMGPTHAMSGAAVGLAVAQILPAQWGGVTTIPDALMFAGIAAGGALLPDLDSPQATVSRSFGPLSQGLSRVVENASQTFVNLTRSRKDPYCRNGHRTATHTLWFALGTGAAAAALMSAFGKAAAVALLFVLLGLAIRGLLPEWSKKADWLVITGVSALVAWAAWQWAPNSGSGVVMGSAVTIGVLTHLAGDFITKRGIPLLAPLPLGRQRWRNLGTPKPLRIAAAGPTDKVLLTAFTLMVLVQLYLVITGTTIAQQSLVPALTESKLRWWPAL
ncbi:hypothetical protein A6F49_07530 [Enteractinococcus helveticum]|uniref:Metal-dependent hydrolase n=2 Tax=Enteractinococcus helveticum TaxID=1837282 RepID=A0A1B7M184_9MICC|nr:hypothetical protein A6F49_07530 [Enteractinococcus helveticum]